MLPLRSTGNPVIEGIVDSLCQPSSYQAMMYDSLGDVPMPSLEVMHEIVSRLRAALFPGYFSNTRIVASSLRYHLAANIDSIYHLLVDQIRRGICFTQGQAVQVNLHDGNVGRTHDLVSSEKDAQDIALKFISKLPEIRDLLASDVKAAYEGDPAAKTPGETIFCYPSLVAMTNHRIAHALYSLGAPLLPRVISEMAHSATGIDIHPGAQIGSEFFIDHGTGLVIGETCIIGKQCRIYQGVTLGALSFSKHEDGTLVKGQPRHPILEDNVTVYAGATILGRVTIGAGSIIGGNVWVTTNVAPGSRLTQSHAVEDDAPMLGTI